MRASEERITSMELTAKKSRPVAVRDFPPGCRPGSELMRGPDELVRQASTGRRGKSKVDDLEEAPAGKKVRADGAALADKHYNEAALAWAAKTAGPGQALTSQEVLSQQDDRTKILNILTRFDALRRFFLQQQESGLKLTSRPDMRAGSIMMDKKENLDFKGIGNVPGVNVGDCFFYRFELMLVGLHRQSQAGIAWVGSKALKEEPLGCSVIASGGYEDDVDSGDRLTYTGQGGNNYKGDRRQGKDQKAERGNLALQNSWKQQQPVRVIRGHHKIASSPSGKVYSYDGLYMVENQTMEVGNSGFQVFKFYLRRLPDQPELGSNVVRFMGKLNQKPSQRVGLVMADISREKEPLPVCVVNTIDTDLRPPEPFHYTATLRYSSQLPRPLPPPPPPCHCRTACHDARSACACLARNLGKMLPYNHDGNLVRARPIVYECGSQCGCSGKQCFNRVSQKGVRHRLEIFKTKNRGWGVRSWDFIPSGGFVCEYTGELIDTSVANELENDEYLFNLDFKKGNEARWGDVSDIIKDVAVDVACPVPDAADYVIDASKYGGVARFINHSCEPNLFVQCVLYDHHDLRFPHIMLFANSNIPPFRELTYDYGYSIDSVYDSNGNLKQKACHCGAPSCRKRLY